MEGLADLDAGLFAGLAASLDDFEQDIHPPGEGLVDHFELGSGEGAVVDALLAAGDGVSDEFWYISSVTKGEDGGEDLGQRDEDFVEVW
ncbi:MAG: hypothetical protein R3B70_25320 [Polyangiaceae bacterium]